MSPDRAPGRPTPVPAAFVLKVDVDTELGLRDGAPRLLELFSRHGVRASWFVAMGPDRTGRAALRALRQKGFLRKMIRSRAPSLYPWRTMLRGTLLPSTPIAGGHPDRLREIEKAGHELGVHGWDHVRWHDELAGLPPDAVRAQVERAVRLFREILGRAPEGFAAPGWQCSAASLRAVDEAGFLYRSDTRGEAPYRPVADGYRASRPEIPTTLPTLDEMLGLAGRSADDLARFYAERLRPDVLHVHSVHTEVEGGPCLGHLDALLARVRDRLPVRTLGEIARALPAVEQLPERRVRPGRLPGRGGTVACEAPA